MRWNFLTITLLVSALFWAVCICALLLSDPGYLARPWGPFWLVVFPVAGAGFFLAGLALVLGRGMFLGVGGVLESIGGLFTPCPGPGRLLALALGILCLMLGPVGVGSAGLVFFGWLVRDAARPAREGPGSAEGNVRRRRTGW